MRIESFQLPRRSLHLTGVLFAMLSVLGVASTARAHSTTYAVYSKYEATTQGDTVAFVFAFDKAAVLKLVERDVTKAAVTVAQLPEHKGYFSRYLFARFRLQNEGAACTHPEQLSHFTWDEGTKRVIAVTRFTCKGPLRQLTIHSEVTHDMPISHELVGDLKHGPELLRSFFYDDNVEVRLALHATKGAQRRPAPQRRRGKYSFVAVPDKTRRYEAFTRAELGTDALEQPATDQRPLQTVVHFVGQGALHIFTGYDHVLFIITLLLTMSTWRQLALIVTSFTAAHSLTLALSTLGLVTVPPSIVEPLIALSVLVVAIDALRRPEQRARALATFGFGLVHGFGLSSVLFDLGLAGGELFPALLGFNLGVELGQLCIVAPLFPALLWLRRHARAFARTRTVLSASVAVLAVCWIVERVHSALLG